MNQQDKSFLITFTTVLSVLVLIAVVIFFAARLVSLATVKPADNTRRLEVAAERLKPVGTVAVRGEGGAGAAPAAEKSGEEVFNGVCTSCHTPGVLNAPKVGDNAAWNPRFAKGLDTLVKNAVNGLNQMPPKGGNPALSDAEIRKAILYMLDKSGIQVVAGGGTPAAPATAPAAQPAQPAAAAPAGQPAAFDLTRGKQVYDSACAACHAAGVLQAPKLGDNAAWSPRFAQGLDTLVNHAVNGFKAMPPKGGNPSLSDADVRNAVAYMLSESGIQPAAAATQPAVPAPEAQPATPAQPSAPAAPAQEPQPVAPTAPTQEPQSAAPATPASPQAEPAAPAAAPVAIELPADLDLARGQQLYNTACIICHDAGVAGAPKLGDKQAWAPRLAQGWQVLSQHALQGYKGMPPKGGRMDVPDAEILAAVGYMVSKAR
ncbi:MAG TPA: c-type cytochrome [Candidatus Competibacteraceae bacterium]|nr:c-type cytochrome [Candidatus Competibacteraceae bacterium]